MIRTADLAGALLDYWTARAQGVPAERLEIRQVPRTDTLICVLRKLDGRDEVLPFSTDWRLAGGLIEQHRIFFGPEFSIPDHQSWKAKPQFAILHATGPTPPGGNLPRHRARRVR